MRKEFSTANTDWFQISVTFRSNNMIWKEFLPRQALRSKSPKVVRYIECSARTVNQ